VVAPFNLPWGSSVWAKVTANNIKGSSESEAGNGAVIITKPDSPINLVEETSLRSTTTLGLTWNAGLDDGGTPLLDYRISMEINGVYQVIAATTDNVFTINALTSGVTYNFKVQSRNDYGTSDYSEVISLLCAFVPDAPTQPDSYVQDDQVILTWTDPGSNGSPITGYKIYFLSGDGTYVEETS
jgi:hypothetical protein